MRSVRRPRKVILCLLFLSSISTWAGEGGASGVGGGGDAATEMRINEIRSDLLRWVTEGGAAELILPRSVTYSDYVTSMSKLLTPHAVVIGAVTLAEEQAAQDDELKVVVNGQPKTCRGFFSEKDHLLHILCSVERFANTSASDQYRLIHHEYAGLAGVEQNVGASSDYQISDQLTDFLVPEVVLKLSIKRRDSKETRIASTGAIFVRDRRNPSLGEAWRDPGGTIWSDVLTNMPQPEAAKYCETLGARLPSYDDLVRLRVYLGGKDGRESGYVAQVLPHLHNYRFWSSTLEKGDPSAGESSKDTYAWIFESDGGIPTHLIHDRYVSVRCIVTPKHKGY